MKTYPLKDALELFYLSERDIKDIPFISMRNYQGADSFRSIIVDHIAQFFIKSMHGMEYLKGIV